MKRLDMMIPEPLLENLREIAKEKGISVSELIRRILDAWDETRKK